MAGLPWALTHAAGDLRALAIPRRVAVPATAGGLAAAVTVLGLVCAGLACGVCSTERPVALRAPVRIAAVLAAVGCLGLQLPLLMGASEIRQSREAIGQGRVDEALSAADTAVALTEAHDLVVAVHLVEVEVGAGSTQTYQVPMVLRRYCELWGRGT